MSHTPFFQKIIVFSRRFFPEGCRAVAAVSGGSDSVALLFLLHEMRAELGIAELAVAHFNHGLRGEASDGDELLVKEYARQLDVQYHSKKLTGRPPGGTGIEAWARRERYRFFSEAKEMFSAERVATGHTMDDQAETVLMRIVRGSGLNGLRGIASVREDGIVRPLLTVRKYELENWLTEKGIAFRTDASNSDCRFFRNRIRHQVIPLLEKSERGAVARIAALASEAQEQWSCGQHLVTAWKERYLVGVLDESFGVRKRGLEERAIAAEGLRQLMVKWHISPFRHHINAIFQNRYRTSGIFLLPDGWRYRIGRDTVFFEKSVPAVACVVSVPGSVKCRGLSQQLRISEVKNVPGNLDHGKWIVYVDGDSIGGQFFFRNVQPDDRFIPFGTDREVSIITFLSKQGLTRPERDRTGCLFSSHNIPVWIPGIRMDERFRITSETKIVIKIQSQRFT